MSSTSIHYLLDHLTKGQLTEQEQQQLTEIMQNADQESFVKEELLKMLQAEAAGMDSPVSSQSIAGQPGNDDWTHVLQSVLSIDKTAGATPASSSGSGGILLHLRAGLRKWSVAALLLLALTGGAFYFFHKKQTMSVAGHPGTPVPAAIKPGTDQAILTLADGRQVVLNDAQKGILSRQGNTRVIKSADGKLAYDAGHGEHNGQGAPLYNTITTPRGGQYQVTLPDGTKVWLNAESSIRFPTAFSGNGRDVQLSGEAYFEVAPDKARPFRVQAGATQTLVMGTHFNIMAYNDEAAIRTTLLEGAVRMDQGTQRTALQPGQQGDFDINGGTLTTRTVNTKAVVAWKDGYYYFDRTPVQSVMRQIARWYNVEIEYQGAIPRDEIVGKIPRTAYVSDVLHIMELIGIRFSIEGRKIVVLS